MHNVYRKHRRDGATVHFLALLICTDIQTHKHTHHNRLKHIRFVMFVTIIIISRGFQLVDNCIGMLSTKKTSCDASGDAMRNTSKRPAATASIIWPTASSSSLTLPLLKRPFGSVLSQNFARKPDGTAETDHCPVATGIS